MSLFFIHTLRLSKNRRLIQKEPGLQGEKGLEKAAESSFPFEIGTKFVKKQSFFDKLRVCMSLLLIHTPLIKYFIAPRFTAQHHL